MVYFFRYLYIALCFLNGTFVCTLYAQKKNTMHHELFLLVIFVLLQTENYLFFFNIEIKIINDL